MDSQRGAVVGDPDYIAEGDKVVLVVNNEKHYFETLKAGRKVKLGNKTAILDVVFGHPYGSVFQLSSEGADPTRVYKAMNTGQSAAVTEGRSNKDLVDDNSAQQLTAQDIQLMKDSGKEGPEIIDALVANSSTFQERTEFSQDKYKKKKAKKYCPYFTVLRPTAMNVCEGVFQYAAGQLGYLRPDILAIMLCMGNVAAHKKVLVVDTCLGLLIGAVSEKMGGFGDICVADCGGRRQKPDALKKMQPRHQNIYAAKLSDLKAAQEGVDVKCAGTQSDQPPGSSQGAEAGPSSAEAGAVERWREEIMPDNEGEIPMEDRVEDTQCSTATESDRSKFQDSASPVLALRFGSQPEQLLEGSQRRPRSQQLVAGMQHADSAQINGWAEDGFDSCLVAAPLHHTSSLMQQLMPLLKPSAPFAASSPYLHALVECRDDLLRGRMAAMVEVQESFWREYQVLPERTHPQMDSKGPGAYLLSGVKIIFSDPPPGSAPNGARAHRGGKGGRGKRQRR